MNYWIFKVSDKSVYADEPGQRYEYDNVHSVRVKPADEFLYLQKTRSGYGLTGAGRVARVTRRVARPKDKRSPRVSSIFTAHLDDLVWFSERLELGTRTRAGRQNRRALGLPDDLNRIGWSISMPRIDRNLFIRLLDAAFEADPLQDAGTQKGSWYVDDAWSIVRTRRHMQAFRLEVLRRHNYTCVVCGTRLRSVLDSAHVRRYAADPSQRANPANGICLCSFCHAAFDCGDVAIMPNGSLQFAPDLCDEIALAHFTAVHTAQRREWLTGVNSQFLEERAASPCSSATRFD